MPTEDLIGLFLGLLGMSAGLVAVLFVFFMLGKGVKDKVKKK